MGEQERSDDVDGNRQLEPVLRADVRAAEGAGVVDQDIKSGVAVRDSVGEVDDVGETGKVSSLERDFTIVGPLDDRLHRRLAPRLVPTDHDDHGAQPRQLVGDRPADARRRAGHENDATLDSIRWRPMLQAAARRVSDPRVAAGDGELQRAVDELRDHAGDVITARRPAAAASPIRRREIASSGFATLATPLAVRQAS